MYFVVENPSPLQSSLLPNFNIQVNLPITASLYSRSDWDIRMSYHGTIDSQCPCWPPYDPATDNNYLQNINVWFLLGVAYVGNQSIEIGTSLILSNFLLNTI